ncbi:Spy/CpxP family protein refolding chaperone [Legionella shakespearei]|uniref:Envelope stress induced periplasmic protein n=1 Tax=Legionella shakespearei DSM 23087 TaxID=1122169 RepID=A0A0W0YYH6_9GAMM|nr:Spy/CpxP family protein refolding chaperone [Legionella shakespearei]KTD61962.1 envelope stress induced periplasmic protein [Legionella shakespearei DSM 23087]
MSKKIIWLSALLLSLFVVQPTVACSVSNSKHCHCNDHKKLSKALNLTADQKAKIKAIRAQAKSGFKANYKQLHDLRVQINALAQTDTVDETKLDSLINQRNKIRAAMIKSQVMMQHQIYMLLTAQQKQQYLEIKKQQAAKHS